MQKFKQLTDLSQMVEYCRENLPTKLGEGSSRIAFALSNKYAIKIALPTSAEKGTAQNKNEADISTDPKVQNVVAKVVDADPQYRWIIADLAAVIKSPAEFTQFTKIPWDIFESYVRNFNHKNPNDINAVIQNDIKEYQNAITISQKKLETTKNNPQLQKTLNDKIIKAQQKLQIVNSVIKNPVFVGAITLMSEHNVMPGDIWEYDHWGRTVDGTRVIIIDYGFTRDLIGLYKKSL